MGTKGTQPLVHMWSRIFCYLVPGEFTIAKKFRCEKKKKTKIRKSTIDYSTSITLLGGTDSTEVVY